MKFETVRLTRENLSRWQPSLHALERRFRYPLGADAFVIDHGADYLAFFDRIGKTHLYAVTQDEEIVAVGAGVIHHRYKQWYLCDMKVHPDWRGNKLTVKLFRRYFLPCYLKAQRGFALTMENAAGKRNPIMNIMERLPWTPLSLGARLLFFYEDANATQTAVRLLSASRPHISFSSLAGVKDLVLQSNSQPIKLLHMEWGDDCGTFEIPQAGHLHMWCLRDTDPLVGKLAKLGIAPKASGFIYHHRMGKTDWSQLRTSEL